MRLIRYALWVLLGLGIGIGAGVWHIRTGKALSDGIVNGPWTTGDHHGSADASTLARARVALFGLLALPRQEARYYRAAVDSAGQPLRGTCRYRVQGGPMGARWWSITLYQGEGWLVPNAAKRWSVGSAHITPDAQGRWTFDVAPNGSGTTWLPTGNVPTFDLTLRLYHPTGDWLDRPAKAALPSITLVGCNP